MLPNRHRHTGSVMDSIGLPLSSINNNVILKMNKSYEGTKQGMALFQRSIRFVAGVVMSDRAIF